VGSIHTGLGDREAKWGSFRERVQTPVDLRFSAEVQDGKPPLTFAWDFGDGSPALAQPPPVSHRFEKQGEYEVKLRVVDSLGQSDEETTSVDIWWE
jgi:PKD repeat protein